MASNRPLKRATYARLRQTLINLLGDLDILAGNSVPSAGASMRDVIGTAKTNAGSLALQLEACYQGLQEPFMVFPDPEECLKEVQGEAVTEDS